MTTQNSGEAAEVAAQAGSFVEKVASAGSPAACNTRPYRQKRGRCEARSASSSRSLAASSNATRSEWFASHCRFGRGGLLDAHGLREGSVGLQPEIGSSVSSPARASIGGRSASSQESRAACFQPRTQREKARGNPTARLVGYHLAGHQKTGNR